LNLSWGYIRLIVSLAGLFALGGCIMMPDQVSRMQGEIYELRLQVAQIQARQDEDRGDLSTRVGEQARADDRRLIALEQSQASLDEKMKRLAEEIRQTRLSLGMTGPEKNSGPVSSSTAPAQSPGPQSEEEITVSENGETIDGNSLLLSARNDFSRGNYNRARDALTQYLNHFSLSPRADEARYLLADTCFYQDNFTDALNEYGNLCQKHPGSPRVPDGLIKSAICLEKLGRAREASAPLRRVIEEFPDYHDMHRVRIMLHNIEKGIPNV